MADGPSNECGLFWAAVRSAGIWADLEKLGVPGIQGVWSVPEAAGWGMTVVSIKQMYAGHAAQAMALAAAGRLIGTGTAAEAANAAAQATFENTSGAGNRYYFHGLPIGQTNGDLISTVSDPAYFNTAADAIASRTDVGGGGSTEGAKYVRTTVTAQVPLLFWSFLPTVSDRKVTVQGTAVAGISPPLCAGCGRYAARSASVLNVIKKQ